MAEVPIFIPLVVAGVFLGSIWPKKEIGNAWKKAVLAAAASGVVNAGYVFALGLIMQRNSLSTSQTQTQIPNISLPTNSAVSGPVSMAVAGLTGFLVVVTIYLSMIGMMRYRRGKMIEPEE